MQTLLQHNQVTEVSFNFYKHSEKSSRMKTRQTVFPEMDVISFSSLHSEKTDPGCFAKARVSSIIHFQVQSVFACL